MDFDIFGRNVTDKVSNQKTFSMPSQVTYASALPGKTRKQETEELYFSLKCGITALREFNQLVHFFNRFDSRLILMLQ